MGQMDPGRGRGLTSDRILRARFWGFGGALGSWGHWRGQALEWEVGRGGTGETPTAPHLGGRGPGCAACLERADPARSS